MVLDYGDVVKVRVSNGMMFKIRKAVILPTIFYRLDG